MAKKRTYKEPEKLSTGWVIFGTVVITLWVVLFMAPIWAPAIGLK